MRARLLAPLVAIGALALAGAAPAAGATFFKSPSGNIACALDRGGVRCDIRHRSWQPPPKPRSCPVDFGQGLTVGRRGKGRFVCAGDTVFGTGGKPLGYGKSIQRGRFRCRSRRSSGIRCVNRRNGHGFALSRRAVRRF